MAQHNFPQLAMSASQIVLKPAATLQDEEEAKQDAGKVEPLKTENRALPVRAALIKTFELS